MVAELILDPALVLRLGGEELARVELSGEGVYGKVLVEEATYDISRRHKHGRGFTLHSQGGPPLASFREAPVGRGGWLRGESLRIAIRPRPFSKRWRITQPGRSAVDVTVKPGWHEESLTAGGARRMSRRSGERDVVVLEVPDGPPPLADQRALLTFAAWLVGEWESIPRVGDGGASGVL